MDPQNSREIKRNLQDRVFYHGAKELEDVVHISREGFRRTFMVDGEVLQREGILGGGIYVSCDWQTAVWFGKVLLRVTVKKGTRLLDTSVPPDQSVLRYLKKEFGHELFDGADVRKAIPHNKHLRLHELVAILRYHYHETWEKDYGFDQDKMPRWPNRRCRHEKALKSCASLLKRCGFHGYGNPSDDIGIVIFSPDRIELKEIVANVEQETWIKMAFENKLNSCTLETLKKKYPQELGDLRLPEREERP